ncbi:hypothetical protein [Enterovirga sp. CN4-39]|uniref:hypothetical protein n=1 Tax=Enterovirga sp. CN4-39 TaxID=3400910 RepID=UPI003BFD651A
MTRVAQQGRSSGLQGAVALWRRALALLLCVSFLMGALQPATASDVEPRRDGVVLLTGSGVDHHSANEPSHAGTAQHCAHCACHQAVPLAAGEPEFVAHAVEVKFAALNAFAAAREHEPPAEPPRA